MNAADTCADGYAVACRSLAWCPCAFALDPSLDVSQYAHTAWKIRDGFAKGEISRLPKRQTAISGWEPNLACCASMASGQPRGSRQPVSLFPSKIIWSLLVARDGTLWIGTPKGLAS